MPTSQVAAQTKTKADAPAAGLEGPPAYAHREVWLAVLGRHTPSLAG